MRSAVIVAVLLGCALAASAQQPDHTSGSGSSRVVRGPDARPVLQHGDVSEEAPAIEQHLENKGSLPENLEAPREKNSLSQIPVQPTLSNESASPAASRWPLIVAGLIVAAIVVFIWRFRRRSSAHA